MIGTEIFRFSIEGCTISRPTLRGDQPKNFDGKFFAEAWPPIAVEDPIQEKIELFPMGGHYPSNPHLLASGADRPAAPVGGTARPLFLPGGIQVFLRGLAPTSFPLALPGPDPRPLRGDPPPGPDSGRLPGLGHLLHPYNFLSLAALLEERHWVRG